MVQHQEAAGERIHAQNTVGREFALWRTHIVRQNPQRQARHTLIAQTQFARLDWQRRADIVHGIDLEAAWRGWLQLQLLAQVIEEHGAAGGRVQEEAEWSLA